MKIAIIGAGISGLTAAVHLKEAGHNVTVFEKSRGPGGRTSTRRTDYGGLDHGAQYFTIRDPDFKDFLNQTMFDGTFAKWDVNFQFWKEGVFKSQSNNEDHYVGIPSMNGICKAMCEGLELHRGVRIEKLTREAELWTLLSEDGQSFDGYDWVLSSAPPQQSYDLLNTHTEIAEDIRTVNMRPCFALMLVMPNGFGLPHDAVRFEGHDVLGWAANNHSKPERQASDNGSIILQTNFDWSEVHVDGDKAEIERMMISAAEDVFNISMNNKPLYSNLHRWLYANPDIVKKQTDGHLCDDALQLGAFGDWCIGGRVECAFISGRSMALKMLG